MQSPPVLKPVKSIEDAPQFKSLTNRWLIGINITWLVVIVVFAYLSYRTQNNYRNDLHYELSILNHEMEQLRTDVVTTSSENVVFLKILLLKPGIDKGLARDIAHSLTIRAREHHRDPDLILAIIDIESDFNPSAVSHMGAIGLMQIMPMWIETLAIERDLRDIDTSINYGLKILGTYEKIYGTLEMALTVYNKGPTSTNADLKYGRNPFNGYAESIMRTYSRIKSWARP